ncbi:MAG: sigma-70 family RNA polymerase sigma factor [Gemmatimonadetes bacterium]|nr:sigma-70 family RNA polymerase sigma factor [Gemmatimonadota bacterium]
MADRRPAEVPPDRTLVARMASGDDRALGALYDRYGRTAYALALAVVREPADAEEVVVDVFGQAWRTAGSFDAARGGVGAWLCTIARSRALDLVRARARRSRTVDEAARLGGGAFALPVTESPDPAGAVVSGETAGLVRCSLAELQEPQRRVIELAYFEGLTQSEIAERLGEPLGTVKTRTRAALERLRGLLAGALAEEAW